MRTHVKWLVLVVVCALLVPAFACGGHSNTTESPQATALPQYPKASVGLLSNLDDVVAYCIALIENDNGDFEALADRFAEALADTPIHTNYVTDYQNYNQDESYLLLSVPESTEIPVTDASKLGKAFYAYMDAHGQFPFQYVEAFADTGTPMIAFGFLAQADTQLCRVWLVRGSQKDALHLLYGLVTLEDFSTSIYMHTINADWYIFYDMWNE